MSKAAVKDRVELIRCADPYTKLAAGTRGTVAFIDDLGTVHIRWDDGTLLGLVPGEDEFRVLGSEASDGRT